MNFSQWDPLLHPFLRASTGQERANALTLLLQESIQRLTQTIARSELGNGVRNVPAEIEDVVGEIDAKIIQRLQSVHETPNPTPILRLTAWVRQIAYNETSAHLRQKYPKRRSVNDKLRYLLEGGGKRSGIGMWRDAEGELVCGFDAWQEKAMPSTSPRLQRLLEDPRRGLQAAIKIIDTIDDPARQVGAVYQWVGHPISMGDLIYIMQELWNKKDTPDEALEAGVQDPAYDPNMPARVVQEFELQQLWERILQLNLPERTALLLQAQDTDGNSVLELLTLHNITDFDSLANAISITPEELANLWNDLPLDDACIAEHLGVPVKKVAMLRYNAREHLRKQTKKGIE